MVMSKNNDDFLSRFEQEEELLRKQVYIDEGHIVINVKYEYNIELVRCDTNEKILAWVHQLCEKPWVDVRIIHKFVVLAQEHHGLSSIMP